MHPPPKDSRPFQNWTKHGLGVVISPISQPQDERVYRASEEDRLFRPWPNPLLAYPNVVVIDADVQGMEKSPKDLACEKKNRG